MGIWLFINYLLLKIKWLLLVYSDDINPIFLIVSAANVATLQSILNKLLLVAYAGLKLKLNVEKYCVVLYKRTYSLIRSKKTYC